ncbi:MAG TPA: UDP-glucose/GDP-mannose dehydrogenase family protein [Marmoricola sp.]|nr:UDP-glucose/GDP-mannose dehydrogenase family protein [Marmoricola sp.]
MAASPTGIVISVVGCGYLGAVHAASMAALGHTVVGVDNDPERSDALSAGKAPFYEPGLEDLLADGQATGRLRFSIDISDAAAATVHFLCVGTPQATGQHAADLAYVESAVTDLLEVLKPGDVVVGKSTVPVGTAAEIATRIRAAVPGADLIWNPEFLREGFAIEDTLQPDRIVFGLEDGDGALRARRVLEEVYAPILAAGTPLIVTNYATAELVKVAANAFLATKISFINAMADLCDLVDGDVAQLADALGHDQRIGRRFLNAGLGFGGGCLPKDIRAFMHRAGELGADQTLTFLREVDTINLRRREQSVLSVQSMLDGQVAGRRIGVLGASFKPDSDDIRDSPALAVAEALHLLGADVHVYDPRATVAAQRKSPQLRYRESAYDAAAGAEVVLLLTEWREFVDLDPDALGEVVAHRRIFDGRNALDPERWSAAGWDYRCLGRPGAGRRVAARS